MGPTMLGVGSTQLAVGSEEDGVHANFPPL
jgi:hypothetical protein